MSIIDLTLGLNAQATAVLHLLDYLVSEEYVENDYGTINTSAHYNGRECGYSLLLQRKFPDRQALVIVWGENRNSDSIFVQHALMPISEVAFGVPAGLTEESYEKRKYFGFGKVEQAAEHIAMLIEKHLTSYEEDPVTHQPARRRKEK